MDASKLPEPFDGERPLGAWTAALGSGSSGVLQISAPGGAQWFFLRNTGVLDW